MLVSFTSWNDEIPREQHAATADAATLLQYADSARLHGFLASLTAQLDSLEALAYQMLACRSVYTAVGVQLDMIGVLVGYPRPAVAYGDDDLYRLLLLAAVRVRRGNGRWEELWEILRGLGLATDADGTEYAGPCALATTIYAVTSAAYAAALWAVLSGWRPAGVAWQFGWTTRARADSFATSTDPAVDVTDAAAGTANLAGTTGGRLIGTLS